MLPPVIPCDDKYYKNMSALVPIKTKSDEPKDVKEALVEITGETRQPVKFRPCLDCGCEKHPYLSRGIVHANGKPLYVQAECYRCGWRTVYHKSVKECAKEWNEAEV